MQTNIWVSHLLIHYEIFILHYKMVIMKSFCPEWSVWKDDQGKSISWGDARGRTIEYPNMNISHFNSLWDIQRKYEGQYNYWTVWEVDQKLHTRGIKTPFQHISSQHNIMIMNCIFIRDNYIPKLQYLMFWSLMR